MTKISLLDIGVIATAGPTINANNARIEAALENTLSRDGTAPNEMNTSLDMNGQRVYNLPAPLSPNDAARLTDLDDLIGPTGPVGPQGIQGTQGPVGPQGTQGIQGTQGPVGPAVADGDKGDITVSSSGAVYTIDTNTITFSKLAQASARTLLGNATGSTANITTIAAGQFPATQTNDNAATGTVSEYVESVRAVGSALGLTTATATNMVSISLTAGDWDVSGCINWVPAATTMVTDMQSFITSLGGTSLDFTLGHAAVQYGGNSMIGATTNPTTNNQPVRFSLNGTTTIYLNAYSSFSVSTMSVFGLLRARRVR